MKVLYYMDPFVDLDKDFDDRSFIAKVDLNADFLGKYPNKDTEVYFVALESLLKRRDILSHLSKHNVQIIQIPDREIAELLSRNNITINMLIARDIYQNHENIISEYLSDKLKAINPDIIVYWESCIETLYNIFPDAIFLEGSHTGFWRLEQNVDILYNISTKKYKYSDVFFNEISNYMITKDDLKDLEDFRYSFKDYTSFETQLDREYLDPEHKFKHLILYAGNFPSLRFKGYSGFASNSAFVQYLLEKLPEDCAIVYSKHQLDKNSEDFYLEQNPRIINLAELGKNDSNITLRVMPYVDAVINVYSNVFMIAMTMGIPVFTYGTSPNASFCLDTIDNLVDWLKNGKMIPEKYTALCNKILKYVITHKINSSFLRNSRNVFIYLSKVKENIDNGKPYLEWLPVMSTIKGYTGQFKQNILLQNPSITSYNNTKYDELLYYLLDDNIKNIGFDIFDTMLYRPLMKPTDLFDLLEDDIYKITGLRSFNFSKTRIAAESIARFGRVETTLDDIYKELQKATGFSDDNILKMKALEQKMEESILSPRITLQNYFHLAQMHNKNIFIASDMYLPEQYLRNVLEKKGYNLSGVKLFISCEHNKVKHNGSLYNHIIQTERIKPSETLFIGDNFNSDVIRAKDSGMLAFHYPKAIDILKTTTIFNPSVMNFTISNNFSFHIAFIANKIFDNPFVPFNKDTFINNSASLLGYFILGPLVLSITQWLISEISTKTYDKILFSSRDSRIIVDIYNKMNEQIYNNKLPHGEYVYLSRTSTLPAYSDCARKMTLISMYNSKLTIHEYIKKIFNIDIDKDASAVKILKQINLHGSDESRNNLNKLAVFIQKYSEENKKSDDDSINLRLYFESIIKNKKIAMFDLGARGTSRDIIADFLDINIDLYLFREIRYKCANNIKSYFIDTQNSYRHGIRAVFPQFYELLLSDIKTTTCYGYEKIGDEVYPIIEKMPFTANSSMVLATQNFIYKFCFDYINTFMNKTKYINSQPKDLFILPISWLCAHTTDTTLLLKYGGQDPLWKDVQISIIAPPLRSKQKSMSASVRTSSSKTEAVKNKKGLINKINSNKITRRDIYIFFKRYFYRTSLTQMLWDKGRSIYIKIINK